MSFHRPAFRLLLSRYLLSKSMVLPVLGVGIGILAYTIVMSIMGGFVQNLKNRLLSMESHIEIVKKDGFGFLEEKPELIEMVERISNEIVGVSPFQKGDAILQSQARAMTVFVVGIDSVRAKKSSGMEKYLADKNFNVLDKDMRALMEGPEMTFPPLVMGDGVASLMRVDVGDRVTLVSTLPEEGPGGLAPKQMPFVVADTLHSGNMSFDAKWIVVSLEMANHFFGTEGMWAGLQVKIKDPLNVEELIPELDLALAPHGLRAKPWTESNRAFLKALKLERWGMNLVMTMITIVGCFSITITLVLAVKRKQREMAVLRSVGLSKHQLGALYLWQGFLIGILGVAWGLGLGLALLYVLEHVSLPFLTSAYTSRPGFPVLIDKETLALFCGSSLVLAILAAFWPSFEVMKIDVVETLSDR
jgi:lipoprotein-releasing system permease protein